MNTSAIAMPTRRRLGWMAAIKKVQVGKAFSYLAFFYIVVLVLAAIFPTLLTSYDPIEGDFLAVLQPPSGEHWLGTDRLGRDVWARIVYGARYSLQIGVLSALIALVGGGLLGMLAGQSRTSIDESISRFLDVISSFPSVLLAMIVVIFLGPGLTNIAIAVGISGIPKFGRVVRAQTLLVCKADYVTHAYIYGRNRFQIFFHHILPNVLSAVPVITTVFVGSAILVSSGLSFLGLGPQPPSPEWGVMLADSRDVLRVAWWPSVYPGLAITLTVIAFTLFGNALQRRFEGRSS